MVKKEGEKKTDETHDWWWVWRRVKKRKRIETGQFREQNRFLFFFHYWCSFLVHLKLRFFFLFLPCFVTIWRTKTTLLLFFVVVDNDLNRRWWRRRRWCVCVCLLYSHTSKIFQEDCLLCLLYIKWWCHFCFSLLPTHTLAITSSSRQ